MNRGGLAALLLMAWIAALGWQAKRIYFPAEAQRLALGMRLLPPGVAYYAVYRGGERVGWAQVEIDTLPAASGFHVRDRVFLDLAALGVAGRSERESDEYLDAGLNLDSLTHTAIAGDDTSRVRVVSAGDSAVVFFDSDGRQTNRVSVAEAVTTSSGWRLRLAAAGRAEAGQRFGALVVDPLVGIARAEEVEVLEAASLAFPDSADTDSISGAWISVREDTVRAWRLRTGQGAGQREAWVDEDGRLVDGQIFGGLRVERTAFELAFFTRPPSTPQVGEAEPQMSEEPN
jgi:hypothetical protein